MNKNVGKIDRIIRFILGTIFIVVGILNNNWLIAIGAILLLTAFLNRCLLYYPFKINTKK